MAAVVVVEDFAECSAVSDASDAASDAASEDCFAADATTEGARPRQSLLLPLLKLRSGMLVELATCAHAFTFTAVAALLLIAVRVEPVRFKSAVASSASTAKARLPAHRLSKPLLTAATLWVVPLVTMPRLCAMHAAMAALAPAH